MNQGAMPEVDGIDICDIAVAMPDDPHREPSDLTPDQAVAVVRGRILD